VRLGWCEIVFGNVKLSPLIFGGRIEKEMLWEML
jgi:hypothetical protein